MRPTPVPVTRNRNPATPFPVGLIRGINTTEKEAFVHELLVALACILLVACSPAPAGGPHAHPAPAPTSAADPVIATTHDWLPNDSDRVIGDFVRQCSVESTWADEFHRREGRQPVLRVGVIEAEIDGVTVPTEALAGQLEKALLDSKKVQVAASIQDLAELQELQSARLLADQPVETVTGADLASDHLLTVVVRSSAEPTESGVVRTYSVSFRVVNTATGAMECVATATTKKLVVEEE